MRTRERTSPETLVKAKLCLDYGVHPENQGPVHILTRPYIMQYYIGNRSNVVKVT